MPRVYEVIFENTCDIPIGTIVYSSSVNDYGCANGDSRMTGEQHISVSRTQDGDYPLETCQLSSLKEIA